MTEETDEYEIRFTSIGYGIDIAYAGWHPDRELNPQSAHLPDVEKYCLLLQHNCNGDRRANGCVLDGEVSRELHPSPRARWTVEEWEPLTLRESLLCRACGLHGFIKHGRWIKA